VAVKQKKTMNKYKISNEGWVCVLSGEILNSNDVPGYNASYYFEGSTEFEATDIDQARVIASGKYKGPDCNGIGLTFDVEQI
jgi:hypothetical protein